MQGIRRNLIYLFYEEVACAADGTAEPGTKYYKAWQGNRKTFKITAKMRGNLNGDSAYFYFCTHLIKFLRIDKSSSATLSGSSQNVPSTT